MTGDQRRRRCRRGVRDRRSRESSGPTRRSSACRRFPTSCARWRAPASKVRPGARPRRDRRRRCSTTPRTTSACDDARVRSRLAAGEGGATFARPYVISWNLTYRCNLACEHCYLDAGGKPAIDTPAFADRSELDTAACFRVVDEIAAFAPDGLLILTGGEPLLRRDIVEIIRYAAARELWVVVGTNGVKITENLAAILKREGVRGLSLSLDALDETRHDAFRRVTGALSQHGRRGQDPRPRRPAVHRPDHGRRATTSTSSKRSPTSPTTSSARESGTSISWSRPVAAPTSPTSPTPSTIACSAELAVIQRKYAGRMLVNAKCAPHYVRILQAEDPHVALSQELRRRRRRLSGRHALHGHPAERRRHAVSLSPALRRQPETREPRRRSGERPRSSSASATAKRSADAAARASSTPRAAAAGRAPTA